MDLTKIIKNFQTADDNKRALFVTLTLYPCHHKKPLCKQVEIMLQQCVRLTHRGSNDLRYFEGCMELTNKGNIHAHLLVQPSPEYDDYQPTDIIKMLRGKWKYLPFCDIQVPKDIKKVKQYIVKDYNVTRKVLNRSPFFRNRGLSTEEWNAIMKQTMITIKEERWHEKYLAETIDEYTPVASDADD